MKMVKWGKVGTSEEEVVTITPCNNTQSWIVKANMKDDDNLVDFRVPNYPNPPSVPLRAILGGFYSAYSAKEPTQVSAVVVFTDPSGTLAKPHQPLNTWYDIKGIHNGRDPPSV